MKEDLPLWSGVLATAGDVVFYGTMDGWFKAIDARTCAELWKFKTGSGIVGNPIAYKGPDGKEYIAIYSGIGGWMGAVAFPDVSLDDPYTALGVAGAVPDLKKKIGNGRHAVCLRPLAVAPGSGSRERLTIPLHTELLVLALPAVLLVLVRRVRCSGRPSPVRPPIPGASRNVLRVCADPNNLPFSNQRAAGIRESRSRRSSRRTWAFASRYTWWPERRGFIRNTLKARDVRRRDGGTGELTSSPSDTAPYYRSTYVFVTRADRHLTIRSFDDPALRHLGSAFT